MDPPSEFEAHFGALPEAWAEAPGRVNLIGEHTDYNMGLVLPCAVDLRARVGIRARGDVLVRGFSRECGVAEAPLAAAPAGDWLDYARGIARVLAAEGRIPARGFDVAVASEVPPGAGLSSSAALEVAIGLALAALAGAPFELRERAELARLCQRAESSFVGVPCGVMDPYASSCAVAGSALLLDCGDLSSQAVTLPDELEILIVDTGIRRELREGGYETRLRECLSAGERASEVLGRQVSSLSELHPSDLGALEGRLGALLERRVRHVVTENGRVFEFARALRNADLPRAGQLLYASHRSLRDDFEVSWPEADELVRVSREMQGVIGARMTGAGWGGCTLHLVRAENASAAREALADALRKRSGRASHSWLSRPAGAARALRPVV